MVRHVGRPQRACRSAGVCTPIACAPVCVHSFRFRPRALRPGRADTWRSALQHDHAGRCAGWCSVLHILGSIPDFKNHRQQLCAIAQDVHLASWHAIDPVPACVTDVRSSTLFICYNDQSRSRPSSTPSSHRSSCPLRLVLSLYFPPSLS